MKIIDLFSGCGGLSLGFEMAKFKTVLAVEIDKWASETYNYNHPKIQLYTQDIRRIKNPLSLLPVKKIDGIIGGPPCQGFSLSGDRDVKDPRNSLFVEFVRFVKIIKPKFFIMENVPGIMSMKTKKGEKVISIIRKQFEKNNYKLIINKLNAAFYGVPQLRERIFFFGIRKDFPMNPDFLIPKKIITNGNFFTLNDAISDLPKINTGEGEPIQKYLSKPKNSYQKIMRKKSRHITNHIPMRHTQRLIERFKVIKIGQSLSDVPAEHMQRKRGQASKISGKIYGQNNMRPHPNKPSPTIAASFQSNFIHPFLNRNFTAREAARIQSFPDWYEFKGNRTTMSWEKNLSQYQQIGNAVSPMLSFEIAKSIKSYLENVENIIDNSNSYQQFYQPELLF